MAEREINVKVTVEGQQGGKSQSDEAGKRAKAEKETLSTLESQITASKSVLEQQKLLRKAVQESAREFGVSADKTLQLKRQLESVNKQVRDFNQVGKESQNTWNKALSSYQFKFNALGNIIANVTSTAIRLFVNGLKSVISISQEFESSMAGVQAITRATGDDFERLRKNAISLGGATIFTANDVAQLQMQLGKLGFTVTEIINATEGILALAAATDEELARSAMVAGSTLRAFNLNAVETTPIVDVMAKSFTSSALDLERFTESMKFLGPVAKVAGFTMAETTAILGKLADKMIYGSLAGTSMRNIMLRFADESSKLSKAIGFTVTNVAELAVAMDVLKSKGLDATMALELTDRRAVTTMLALADMSDTILEFYGNIIDSHDAATQMSEVRMDTFAGSVEKLEGAWESFVQTINKGNGVLRIFVDGLTYLLDDINTMIMNRQQRIDDANKKEIQGLKKNIDQRISLEKALNAEALLLLQDRYRNKIITAEQFLEIAKQTRERELAFEKNHTNESLQAAAMASEDRIAILEREFDGAGKRRKKKIEKELEQERGFLFELVTLYESAQTKIGGAIEEIDVEDTERKQWALRIKAMNDGMEKEIEQTKYFFAELEKDFEEAKMSTVGLEKRQGEEIAEIRAKYRDKERKDNDKALKDRLAFTKWYNQLEIDAMEDGYVKKSEIEKNRLDTQLEIIEQYNKDKLMTTEQYDRAIEMAYRGHARNLFNILKDEAERRIKLIEEENKEIAAKYKQQLDVVKRSMKEINDDIVDGQEKKAATLDELLGDWLYVELGVTTQNFENIQEVTKKGVDFIVGQMEYLSDKQVELTDRRVAASERAVDQAQRNLEIEIALAEKGFANNVSLRQKELENARQAQEQALKDQEAAQRRQAIIEGISQGVNLASAAAEIFKTTAKDPTTLFLAIATIGTMIGAFALAKGKIKGEVQKFGSGGEVMGKKHSQGGQLIEAEGGEFVVKASQYAKYKELVNAINNDKMNKEWQSVNRDLSVSLDDTRTSRMLDRHFGRQVTQIPNGRIERYGNRTRVIRYA